MTAVNGAQYRRSKARYNTNNHVDDSVLEARWQRAAADADWDMLRMPRCFYKDTEAQREWKFGVGADGKHIAQRFMVCVACGVAWPCTTMHFTAAHASYEGGIDRWLQRSEPGAESFRNSSSRPCNACFAEMDQTTRSTPEGRLLGIMRKYPLLDDEWRAAQALIPLCRITGLPKTLAEGAGQHAQWGLSVNQVQPDREPGVKYSGKTHTPEKCEVAFAVANVRQGATGPLRWRARSLRSAFPVLAVVRGGASSGGARAYGS